MIRLLVRFAVPLVMLGIMLGGARWLLGSRLDAGLVVLVLLVWLVWLLFYLLPHAKRAVRAWMDERQML